MVLRIVITQAFMHVASCQGNVKEYKKILLDNALSLYNVCHRCLFPIPSCPLFSVALENGVLYVIK